MLRATAVGISRASVPAYASQPPGSAAYPDVTVIRAQLEPDAAAPKHVLSLEAVMLVAHDRPPRPRVPHFEPRETAPRSGGVNYKWRKAAVTLCVETLSDAGGVIVVGWVGDGVLWAKFTGMLSAQLGASYAVKLERYIKSGLRLRYFVDASSMHSYDLLARSATARVLMANRQRIESMVVLSWSGGISSTSRAVMIALDDLVETTTSTERFDAKLTEAAPLARQKIDPKRWGSLSARAPTPR